MRLKTYKDTTVKCVKQDNNEGSEKAYLLIAEKSGCLGISKTVIARIRHKEIVPIKQAAADYLPDDLMLRVQNSDTSRIV